jgi:hypothetical protein
MMLRAFFFSHEFYVYDDLMMADDFATCSATECVFLANLLSELENDLDPTPLICHNEIAVRNLRHAVADARIRYAEMLAHCSDECNCLTGTNIY